MGLSGHGLKEGIGEDMAKERFSELPNVLQADREHYVTDNLKLVYLVLKTRLNISQSDAHYEDYVQEGMYALTLAAARYNEELGASFTTFACSYIEGYMRRYRRDFANCTFRIPRKVLNTMPAIYELLNEGYDYNHIAEKLHIKGMDIMHLINVKSPVSLDAPIRSGENHDSLLSSIIGGTIDDYEALESDDRIDHCIECVAGGLRSELHKGLWYDYIYPAVFDKAPTQAELAGKYHISQSYAARILSKAKKQFQQYMTGANS